MSEFRADITVIGGGIAGLYSAKELIDQGLKVDVVEKSENLATGPTTRNEGWLHAGTYHSVAIYDEADAQNVTARTMYGHNAIVNFAPESIEHSPTYAFVKEDALVHTALQRWSQFGIQYQEVPKDRFGDEGFDLDAISAAFEVSDKSVNSRLLCEKLAHYITEQGGRIFTSANFTPTSNTTAEVEIDGELHRTRSDLFIVTAGTGTKSIFEEMTGNFFPMRYFKSHLLVTPRLTEDNYFYLDPLETGIMSHGGASIVGINREAVEVTVPDYEVVDEKRQLIQDALKRMLPRAVQLSPSQMLSVACVKADIGETFRQQNIDPTIVMQDLNIKVFEPTSGYICAIPGKMTEAPALARAVVDYVMGKELRDPVSALERQTPYIQEPHKVNLRPADHWMSSQLD